MIDKLEKIIQLLGALGVLLAALTPVVTALAAFIGGIVVNKKKTLDAKATNVNRALQEGGNLLNTLAHYGMSIQEAIDHKDVPMITKDTKIQ